MSVSIGKKFQDAVLRMVPSPFKDTVLLRTFGLTKIPLLFFISPSVIEMTDERCVIRVPLNRRTRNHLKSMYFGVLCAGADCAGGLLAMRLIENQGNRVNLVFKDFQAEFLKRAEGDVHFTSSDGAAVAALVEKAMKTGDRENLAVTVIATTPKKLGDEPVARFTLTLSLKRRGSS